jgi:hypothetical protein
VWRCQRPEQVLESLGNTYRIRRVPIPESWHVSHDENILSQESQSVISVETPGGRKPTSPKVVVAFTLNNTGTSSAVFGSLDPLPNAPVCTAIAWCAPTVTPKLPSELMVKLRRN